MCAAAADLLATPGVGITLTSGDSLQSVAATEAARDGEQLQADLGEGPCYDADRSGTPSLADDLAAEPVWPAFGPAAVATGIRSAFAFPLHRGAVRLGALDLYRPTAEPLSDDQHADALVLARLVSDLLISLQLEMPARELHRLFTGPAAGAWETHQATGMVAAQLGVPVADAMARLRAHAYANGRTLKDVAADVVSRELRLGDEE
jgi:GAF domain-containing protein